MNDRPPLILTQGDPAGVGPELTLKAWEALRATGPAFAVIGDPSLYGEDATPVDDPGDAGARFQDGLPVIAAPLAAPAQPGRPAAVNAPGVLASIEDAVEFASTGRARGVVTNPVAKAVLYDAGFSFPGHTEFIAHLVRDSVMDGARGPVMMLAAPDVRVALATIHMPLSDVPGAINVEGLANTLRVTCQALRRDFGVTSPRVAVCGLNPHAGEGGALGVEERDVINPAAQLVRAEGEDVSDALPADALFHGDARSRWDAVVAMYHDQGLTPVKTLAFHDAVNVTLGLPIVRTSPDHGTAFDIAGTGHARADSLIAAVRVADAIAARRAQSP